MSETEEPHEQCETRTEAPHKQSESDKPPYMSETEAPHRQSESDKPPYMSETEEPYEQSGPGKSPYTSETEASPTYSELAMLSESMMKAILLECHYNWFEFQDRLTDLLPNTTYSQQNALLQK